jgi:hypothetical protein
MRRSKARSTRAASNSLIKGYRLGPTGSVPAKINNPTQRRVYSYIKALNKSFRHSQLHASSILIGLNAAAEATSENFKV